MVSVQDKFRTNANMQNLREAQFGLSNSLIVESDNNFEL